MMTHSAAPTNLRFLWATPASAANARRRGRNNDELLAATAHELRLPLSHIKGFVSSLRRSDVQWDEPTRRDFLAEIEIETDRLTRLVEHMLEAAGRERSGTAPGSEGRTATSPAALIEGGLHRMRGPLRGRSVRVDVPPWLPDVRVDADAIERVLANLLQNAAKYSPPAGRIEISARLVDFDTVELAVADEGPGVPAEDRERIFEPFFRKQPTLPGNGLGLAICEAIVQAHGGGIRVDDAPGGGARFTIRLPVDLASHGWRV